MSRTDWMRTLHMAQLLWSGLALVAGGWFSHVGQDDRASQLWLIGALPAVALLLVDWLQRLWRREMGLDVIALASIGVALWFGAYLTGIIISVMLGSGQLLEAYAQARAGREMQALLSRVPRRAHRYEGDRLVEVDMAAVVRGDLLLIRSGEVVPVDGVLEDAAAVLDESALTGESLPVRHQGGEPLRSGVLNAGQAFKLRAGSTAADSTFAGIVRLVASAQQSKAPATRMADRYALLFVPFTAVLAALAWWWSGDLQRLLAVLVVATPCPLILAVPVAIVSGLSRSASRGVLVKGGEVLERLAQSRTLLLDKTGTLTGGRARVVAIETDPCRQADEVLRLAASLEQASAHVLAASLVETVRRRGLSLSTPTEVVEEPGAGLRGRVDGHLVLVGSHAYVHAQVPQPPWCERIVKRMGYEGAAGVFVAVDGEMAAALLLADEIRVETPMALRHLRRAGIDRIAMVTGDRREVAEAIGTALGVDQVHAEQTPQDKLQVVTEASRQATTVMVGDGVNDAPALAAASVGVAMGARGTAASSESADVVLLVDRLDRLAEAFQIARQTRAIALQSVVAGMGLSVGAMVLAAAGFLPPLWGAVLQEVIDVAVILNALRALSIRTQRRADRMLPTEVVAALRAEHDQLRPVLDRIRSDADQLVVLSPREAQVRLKALDALLHETLLNHERDDEARLYPDVARKLGGEDPLSSMSRTHREIARLAHVLHRMIHDLDEADLTPTMVPELQRLLYGLDAICRLHFAQEEEIFHSLQDAPEPAV